MSPRPRERSSTRSSRTRRLAIATSKPRKLAPGRWIVFVMGGRRQASVFTATDELVVPASRWKLVAAILGSIAFVLLGLWILRRAPRDGVEAAAAGLASIAFFGLCGVYAGWRLVRPRPAVVIDRQGILDNASALSVGLVRWDEVGELYEYRYKNQVMLGIVPRNLDALLMKQPGWK